VCPRGRHNFTIFVSPHQGSSDAHTSWPRQCEAGRFAGTVGPTLAELLKSLTERGRAAAKVLCAAGATIDAALLLRIGPKDLERARRALFALVEIGRKMMEQEGKGNSVT
jgi:hypothetical protein